MRNFYFVSNLFSSAELFLPNYFRRSPVIFAIFIFCFFGAVFQFPAHAQVITNKNIKIQNSSNIPLASDKSKFKSDSKVFSARNLTANTFFVAPNGNSSGNGSINNPWDLTTAFEHPAAIQPGDTIYLRGGKYGVPAVKSGFTSELTGTPENPIKVMSYPGEWAVIDGNSSNSQIKNITIIKIKGAYTWFRDFEITNSETGNRKITTSGSNPPERRGTAIEDQGIGIKIINLVIHDAGQGISSYSGGRNGEYYGNVIYNNGWDAPDRLHGHGFYVQNNSDFKKIEDNFVLNGFGNNLQMYGSSSSFCRNFTWIGNVILNGEMALWGPGVEKLIIKDNHFYNQEFDLNPNMEPTNINADIQNNYFMSGVSIGEFAQNVTFKNNTVWNTGTGTSVVMNTINVWTPSKFTFADNTYYKTQRNIIFGQFKVRYYYNKSRDFAFNKTVEPQRYAATKKAWQEDLGLDVNSQYVTSAPSGIKVFVRPNKYDSGRANVIVYNWNQASVVNVDVSSVLQPGDTYELHNVQDYFGDIITGTYSGQEININMSARTRALPAGYNQVSSWFHEPLQPNTFPDFGAFVLIKK